MASNLIKLIYSLNNEESSVAFDPSNKIGSLKTLINLTQKINLDEYEVFYKKKEIKWTDETPIRNIIGKENVPVFYIKPKHAPAKDDKKTDKTNETEKKPDNNAKANAKEPEKKPVVDAKTPKEEAKKVDNKPGQNAKEGDKKGESKPGSPTKGDLNKTMSVEGGNELTHLKCKVTVEDFPSRPEFLELVNHYKESKQAEKEINLLNTVTGVEITFKNPVSI